MACIIEEIRHTSMAWNYCYLLLKQQKTFYDEQSYMISKVFFTSVLLDAHITVGASPCMNSPFTISKDPLDIILIVAHSTLVVSSFMDSPIMISKAFLRNHTPCCTYHTGCTFLHKVPSHSFRNIIYTESYCMFWF